MGEVEAGADTGAEGGTGASSSFAGLATQVIAPLQSMGT